MSSVALIPFVSPALSNGEMKFIDDIRRDNLKALAEELGGVASLARTLDRSESQISQWTTGAPLPSGKKRGMKTETARWIEQVTGKPAGWLDQAHSPQDTAQPHRVEEPRERYWARPLVKQICELAERIDDIGLMKLQGYAACLLADHPVVKEKRA